MACRECPFYCKYRIDCGSTMMKPYEPGDCWYDTRPCDFTGTDYTQCNHYIEAQLKNVSPPIYASRKEKSGSSGSNWLLYVVLAVAAYAICKIWGIDLIQLLIRFIK